LGHGGASVDRLDACEAGLRKLVVDSPCPELRNSHSDSRKSARPHRRIRSTVAWRFSPLFSDGP
jgi:hypothetical protein